MRFCTVRNVSLMALVLFCPSRPFFSWLVSFFLGGWMVVQSFPSTHKTIASRKCSSLDTANLTHNTKRGSCVHSDNRTHTNGNLVWHQQVPIKTILDIKGQTVENLSLYYKPGYIFFSFVFDLLFFFFGFLFEIRWAWLMMILSAASNAQRRVCVCCTSVCRIRRYTVRRSRRELSLYRRRWRAVSSSFLLNFILRTVFNSYWLMPYSSGPYLPTPTNSPVSLSLSFFPLLFTLYY
jgi:hypothetical protein